ncbi:MAG: hypothetical protein AMXMBFR84_49130 [Candidatus Hydrogenedentota bacterium]
MRMPRRAAGTSILVVSLLFSACPLLNPPLIQVTQDILDKEIAAFNGINSHRTSNGLNALAMNESLREVARKHSQDMAARNFFDHVNPDGADPGDRMSDAGIAFSVAAENIAWNNFPDPAATAVSGWIASPDHLANIMTAGFTQTGMGVASDGAGGFYFTQLFISTAKNDSGLITVYFSSPLASAYRDQK